MIILTDVARKQSCVLAVSQILGLELSMACLKMKRLATELEIYTKENPIKCEFQSLNVGYYMEMSKSESSFVKRDVFGSHPPRKLLFF